MFSDELSKSSWDETTDKILSKTHIDVEEALHKDLLTVDDFMALVSPAAVHILNRWLGYRNITRKNVLAK